MTYAFADFTVTTWGQDRRGRCVWRARTAGRVTTFAAPRAADVGVLARKGKLALWPRRGRAAHRAMRKQRARLAMAQPA